MPFNLILTIHFLKDHIMDMLALMQNALVQTFSQVLHHVYQNVFKNSIDFHVK